MVECPECGREVDYSDELEYYCPFCDEEDFGDGFYRCENCGALFDSDGCLWECFYCENEGVRQSPQNRYYYDDEDCDEDYSEDGIPDVNQGWLGENY